MLDAPQSCAGAPFAFTQDTKSARMKTAQVEVIVHLERGNLSFRTVNGEALLREGTSVPRTYEPVQMNGESTYRVTDRFSPTDPEALYGLGQHQNGMFNYRGATVELGQNNTDVAIPLLVSSRGLRADVEHGGPHLLSTIAFRRTDVQLDRRQVD